METSNKKNRSKKDIYEAMINGDSITDAEALMMKKHFKNVADSCHELGDRFHFAFKEANTEYLRLVDICKARGI